MATFTASQVTDLCEILEVDSNFLTNHLSYHASIISDSDKTKVLSKIDEWATAGADFTAIEPNVRNFGAKINPDSQKNQIRSQIASLLHAKHLLEGFNSSEGVVNPL